jgi:hypothetical protein
LSRRGPARARSASLSCRGPAQPAASWTLRISARADADVCVHRLPRGSQRAPIRVRWHYDARPAGRLPSKDSARLSRSGIAGPSGRTSACWCSGSRSGRSELARTRLQTGRPHSIVARRQTVPGACGYSLSGLASAPNNYCHNSNYRRCDR